MLDLDISCFEGGVGGARLWYGSAVVGIVCHLIHLMTAHEGNISFVSRESRCFPGHNRGKHRDLRETKQMFPS